MATLFFQALWSERLRNLLGPQSLHKQKTALTISICSLICYADRYSVKKLLAFMQSESSLPYAKQPLKKRYHCTSYRVPEHGARQGMSRRMQISYAIKLLYSVAQ